MECDLLVVGCGPGGYTAAIRAAELGLRTVLVEGQQPGGTCLNVGCIPSKALIHVAREARRDEDRQATPRRSLVRPEPDGGKGSTWQEKVVAGLRSGLVRHINTAGVEVVHGWATMLDAKTATVSCGTDNVAVHARNVLLATGSRPVELPHIPFGGDVISSTEALALEQAPAELVVIGGGYIGVEIGSAYAGLGSGVTVIEAEERLLPTLSADIGRVVTQGLQANGVEVLASTRAVAVDATSRQLTVTDANGAEKDLPFDRVLVAVGREPVTQGWGLDGLDLDRDGAFIRVDDQCRTSLAGVYALGDLTAGPMLAHRAIAQGTLVAEVVAGKPRRWDALCVPAVVFGDPEVVSAGVEDVPGRETLTGRAPFAANGRAQATGGPSGFVRVVATKDDHVVVGIHAVGTDIAEMSGMFSVAIEMGARLEDLAGTVFAHPTRSETLCDAARMALRKA